MHQVAPSKVTTTKQVKYFPLTCCKQCLTDCYQQQQQQKKDKINFKSFTMQYVLS